MTMIEDTYLETLETAALNHVNEVLADLEIDHVWNLEKGLQAEAKDCPISRTIMKALDGLDYGCVSYRVTTVYDCPIAEDYMLNEDFEVVIRKEMSEDSHAFQRAFDRGEFPELIAE